MRITSYDPQVSAAVYSERRAAEEGFDSGVATGLARLGRALSEREEGFRRAGAGAMAAREVVSFWDSEVARLDELGAKIPPGKPGFHDLAMKEHLARRTETIALLKETDPEQAALFDLRTRPLVETLEQRASAMEAAAGGQTLFVGVGGALATAVKVVRADPLQHDALHGQLAETLSEMERDGVDAEALARVRASADRSLAVAAIGGLIDDGQFDDARELLTEGRMPALTPEDRREQERLVGRAERRAEATGSAELAAAQDNYWAGFQSLAAGLREGGEALDLRYTNESIRAALPQEQAEKMIVLRDEAEDAGEAHRRVALASPEAVRGMVRDAKPEEARHLRAAARERERRLAEDPAGFVLGNVRVQSAHDAWRAALAGDDPDAIARTARAYARASLDEQRRLGVADAEQRVLPAESATAMVTAFTAGERPDPAALGAQLRERFGDHWRPVLEELKAAGLSRSVADIAGMRRPEQQDAARRLSGLYGQATENLRGTIGVAGADRVNAYLRAILPQVPNPGKEGPIGHLSRTVELVRRLAYDHVREGEAPEAAAHMALEQVLGRPVETARIDRQSEAGELPTGEAVVSDPSRPPGDAGQSPAEAVSAGRPPVAADAPGSSNSSDSGQIGDLEVGTPPITENPEASGAGMVGSSLPEHELDNPLLLENMLRDLKNGPQERIDWVSNQRALGLGPQWWGTLSAPIRDANFAWLNNALSNGDELEREFAVKAVLEADQSALDIRDVLSDEGVSAYVDYWHSSYISGAVIDVLSLSNSMLAVEDQARTAFGIHDLPISAELYRDILARISQVPHVTREQRLELARFVDVVVTPFSEVHGTQLRRAIGALAVGKDVDEEGNETVRFGDIPGPYVEFLTNEDLAVYYHARGLERLHDAQDPHAPGSFWEFIGIVDGAGATLDTAGALASRSVGTVVGATLAFADIKNSIDEHNKALGDFYTKREVYWRLRAPATEQDMSAQLDAVFPETGGGSTRQGQGSDTIGGSTRF